MSQQHRGNTQPAIDQEEHEHSLSPATKRVLAYGFDGTSKQILKVNSSGELESTSPKVQTLFDDVTTTNMAYVGIAPIGTATSASAWTIKRVDESSTPVTLAVKWATAGASTCIWDNRSSLTYS